MQEKMTSIKPYKRKKVYKEKVIANFVPFRSYLKYNFFSSKNNHKLLFH